MSSAGAAVTDFGARTKPEDNESSNKQQYVQRSWAKTNINPYLITATVNGNAQTAEAPGLAFTPRPQAVRTDDESFIYYPAYTHSASRTYFKWVNLTAYEIHRKLQYKAGFTHSWLATGTFGGRDPPQLLFYDNHPIQFVQIVGVVVGFEEWFDRFWLFTIDDSSGQTIDVVCRKPEKDKHTVLTTEHVKDEAEKDVYKEILELSEQVRRDVEIGVVLQVKGTVTFFRRNRLFDQQAREADVPLRQITLQRLTAIPDTNTEVALMSARTKLYNDILSEPWQLSTNAQEKLYRKAVGEIRHKKKCAERHKAKEIRGSEQEQDEARALVLSYESEEKERALAAEMVRNAGTRSLKPFQPITRVARNVTAISEPLTALVEEKSKLHRRSSLSNILTNKRHKKHQEVQKKTSDHGKLVDESMGFSAADDEKLALLRAAFGN